MSFAIMACSGCGQKNRIHSGVGRQRCGRCKKEFNELELMQAAISDTFGKHGVKRVQWEGGEGFDIEGGQP